MEYKACTKCGKELPNTEEYFYKQLIRCKTKPDYYRLAPWCKECSKANTKKNIDKDRQGFYEKQKVYQETNQDIRNKRARDWHQANKAQSRKNLKEWFEKNPEKYKEYYNQRFHKNHYISAKEWDACKKYFDYKCAYCGLPIEEHWLPYKGNLINKDFHKEHRVHDGKNDLSNCIPSCQDCNSHKWEYTFEEWYNEENPRFAQERADKINEWINEDHKLYIEEKPPYRILKEREESGTYHFNLWSIDDKYNLVEIVATKQKRKELEEDIQEYLSSIKS